MAFSLCFAMLACSGVENPDSGDENKKDENKNEEIEKPKPPVKEIFGKGPIGELNSAKIVSKMGVGWNLTNTLDAPTETMWGNPKATKELLNAVKAKGFKTFRVPVSWQNHMGDAPDFTIDATWMKRVEEVVNYGLENEMYVILDVHHDDDWIRPSYQDLDASRDQLVKVWTQIANHFEEYNEKLIFETINEPRLKGDPMEWQGGSPEGRDCVSQLHASAVRAIRATGGNNARRQIMVSPYGANPQAAPDLKLPVDDDQIIISIHSYHPYFFCLADNNFTTVWGSEEDRKGLRDELNGLVKLFVSKGRPVIIGEWGAKNRNNEDYCIEHARFFADQCVRRGICPVVWDFGYIDRHTYRWLRPEVIEAMLEADRD